MNNDIILIAIAIIALLTYIFIIWGVNKKLKQYNTACLWRSLFLALFLAPGLILFGEHAGIPLPSFAWMSAAMNTYNCIEHSVFCSVKLNLFISILPFLATWLFIYMMCSGKQDDSNKD